MRPDSRTAREIASDPLVRMQFKCLSAGIPFDVVDVLSEQELFAYCILMGEMEGGEFDWDTNQWKEPPSGPE